MFVVIQMCTHPFFNLLIGFLLTPNHNTILAVSVGLCLSYFRDDTARILIEVNELLGDDKFIENQRCTIPNKEEQ